MTNAILRGKPYAGNPHVRFDVGKGTSGKPRKGALFYNARPKLLLALALVSIAIPDAVGMTVDLARVKVVCSDPGSPFARKAAAELKKHLDLMVGEHEESGPFVFSVGERPVDAPEPGSFESHVRVCGERVCFWGDDMKHGLSQSKGSLFAVYEFLDRALGVRWVFPGDMGIVAPRMASVELADDATWDYKPTFALNNIRIGSPESYDRIAANLDLPRELSPTREDCRRRYAESEQWLERMRETSADRFRYGHAFTEWSKRHFKEHPDWFGKDPQYGRPEADYRGLQDRLIGREKFCLSHPEVPEAIIADWKANGAPKYFNICPNDGTPGFCRCEKCLKLDEHKPGEEFLDHLTDRYLWFWNQLAARAVRERPDVRLVAYIYSYYRFPPRREKVAFPDNMVFGIVPTETDDYVKLYDAWRAAGMRHFFLRPNYMCYSAVFPRGLEKYLYDNFKTSLAYGMIGVDYDGAPRQVTDFEYYVIASLASHPGKLFNDIAAEFYSQFGSAADVSQAYFERIRRRAETARVAVQAKVRKEERHMLDDSEMAKYAVYGHTLADLEGDLETLRPGQERNLSSAEFNRYRLLAMRAKHAVLTMKFLLTSKGADEAAFAGAAKALHEFRVKHVRELGNEAGAWYSARSGELPAWKRYRELEAKQVAKEDRK